MYPNLLKHQNFWKHQGSIISLIHLQHDLDRKIKHITLNQGKTCFSTKSDKFSQQVKMFMIFKWHHFWISQQKWSFKSVKRFQTLKNLDHGFWERNIMHLAKIDRFWKSQIYLFQQHLDRKITSKIFIQAEHMHLSFDKS